MKGIVSNLIKICFITLQMTEIMSENKQFLYLVTREKHSALLLMFMWQHLQKKDIKYFSIRRSFGN